MDGLKKSREFPPLTPRRGEGVFELGKILYFFKPFPYMKTMIPHEHDHCDVRQSRLLDCSQHPAHLVIHEADRGRVSSPQLSHLEEKKIGKIKITHIFVRKYLVYFVVGIGDIWFCTNV